MILKNKSLTPVFDPAIIRRHITPEWVEGRIRETLAGFAEGRKKSFHQPLPRPEELGTCKALKDALPHPASDEDLLVKIG